MIAKGKTGKPLIGLMGFLGRGNVGDEAIFQCIYEAFRDQFDFVVAVDEHGAKSGWQDWYPYTEVDRISQGDVYFFEKRLAALLVGGGGLGLGFGASQVIAACGAGTPTAFVGTEHTHTHKVEPVTVKASRNFLALFDYVSLRSKISVDWAYEDGINVKYGADWALNLLTDNSADVTINRKRAAVVLREFPKEAASNDYISKTEKLLKGIRDQGYEPVLLPFSPEDERFSDETALSSLARQEVHWWNARRVQQIIASSGLLVSVGRLHPIIFAASVGTPCVQVKPPVTMPSKPQHFQKLKIMCAELRIPYNETIDEALTCTSMPLDCAATEEAVAKARLRLADMISDIRSMCATDD